MPYSFGILCVHYSLLFSGVWIFVAFILSIYFSYFASRFYGIALWSNIYLGIDSLRKLTDMLLSVNYASQKAFCTHHPIEIQKADALGAQRGSSRISYYNASTKPNDVGHASSIRKYISRFHLSSPAGTGVGQPSTNSAHYRGCRSVCTG